MVRFPGGSGGVCGQTAFTSLYSRIETYQTANNCSDAVERALSVCDAKNNIE